MPIWRGVQEDGILAYSPLLFRQVPTSWSQFLPAATSTARCDTVATTLHQGTHHVKEETWLLTAEHCNYEAKFESNDDHQGETQYLTGLHLQR